MRRLSVMLKRPLRLIPSIVRLIAAWGKFFFFLDVSIVYTHGSLIVMLISAWTSIKMLLRLTKRVWSLTPTMLLSNLLWLLPNPSWIPAVLSALSLLNLPLLVVCPILVVPAACPISVLCSTTLPWWVWHNKWCNQVRLIAWWTTPILLECKVEICSMTLPIHGH